MIPRSMQEAAQWHQQNNGQSYSQRMHGQQQGRQPQAHQQPYGYSGGNQAFHGFVEDGSIHSGSGGSGGGRSNRGGGRNDGGGNQAFQGFVEDGSIHSGSGGSGGGRSNRGEEGRTSEAPARRRPDYAGPQDSGPYMMSGGLGPASGGGNRAFQSSGGNRAFQGRSEDRRTHDNGGEFGGGRPNDGNGGGGGRNNFARAQGFAQRMMGGAGGARSVHGGSRGPSRGFDHSGYTGNDNFARRIQRRFF